MEWDNNDRHEIIKEAQADDTSCSDYTQEEGKCTQAHAHGTIN
jgi:hypothetical protein